MKITKTHIAIAILIIFGAIFTTQFMTVESRPEGTTSNTVKCDNEWTDIGYGASANAQRCGSSFTRLDFRMPWGEELIDVKVYERTLKTFNNPIGNSEWLYVWPIGCSGSGTYFIVNYGPPDLCFEVETPDICIGYDLWSQKCIDGDVSKDQILEEKSTGCGYICTTGETKSYPCTDGTPIITQRCIDNTWEEVKPEACPLNWTNLEMILRGYIEDIRTCLEKLL